jgi:pyruvate formate lyase activating enzyme
MEMVYRQSGARAVNICQHCGQQSPPFLVASSLLVPGYIDRKEISGIAAFIASLSPDIPYALLAFHPEFMMRDLLPTSRRHAEECLAEAKRQGLENVRLGNIHLLGSDY